MLLGRSGWQRGRARHERGDMGAAVRGTLGAAAAEALYYIGAEQQI